MNWNEPNNRASRAILDAGRLDDLLADLGCDDLKHHPGGTVYRGQCPVHGGDGPNFELRTDGWTTFAPALATTRVVLIAFTPAAV